MSLHQSYVVCPETISSPAPEQDWIPPNMPCGCHVPVTNEAPVMQFCCPRGHTFIAEPRNIVREETS